MSSMRCKPVPAPEAGPCPKGMKAFAVHVKETYQSDYIVHARDAADAEEITNGKIANGDFAPAFDKYAEYNCEIVVDGEGGGD